MGKHYIEFVVIVSGLAGAVRVLLPRRFAELQLARMNSRPISREWVRSAIFLVVGLVFGSVYLLPSIQPRQVWVAIGVIFCLIGAAESLLQMRFPSLDALVFQSRLLGILYLGLAAGSFLVLTRSF